MFEQNMLGNIFDIVVNRSKKAKWYWSAEKPIDKNKTRQSSFVSSDNEKRNKKRNRNRLTDWENRIEKKIDRICICIFLFVCVCVCLRVCVWEREREREREKDKLKRRETSNECQKNSSSFQCDNERDISYIWSEREKSKFIMNCLRQQIDEWRKHMKAYIE